MNPIYVDYYSHEGEDCYKIDLPWTRYAKETKVLCKVSEGIVKAECLAKEEIEKHLKESFLAKVEGE